MGKGASRPLRMVMVDDISKDLNVLGELINKLQVAYEQFFAGGTRREPLELVQQAERLIKNCSRAMVQNPVQRFRFNSLAARYNSYRQVWDRRRRQMEGTARVKPFGIKGDAAAEDRNTFVISGDTIGEEQVTEIFDAYLDLRKRCNEPVDVLRFENFKATLAEQLEHLRSRTHCQSVVVRLDIRDNKARIAAKPLE